MIRTLLAFLLLSFALNAQQPFNITRSISAGGMTTCGVGTLCLDLGDPNVAPFGIIYPTVVGPHLESFAIYLAPGPPMPGFMVIPQGSVDIDLSTAVLCQAGILDTFPLPNPMYGTNIKVIPTSVANLPVGFSVTVQAIISDPAAPGGWVLTNAIYVFR